MAIHENATVRVIDGSKKFETGKVAHVYDALGIAIVQFENGDLGKVALASLVEIEPQENREIKSEIPEGAKKISRADFDAAVDEATVSVIGGNYRNPEAGLVGALVGSIVGRDAGDKIFKDQDVVVITEEDLVVALWDACNPKCVSASVDNRHSIVDCLDVSVAAILSLRKIGRILFGAENG